MSSSKFVLALSILFGWTFLFPRPASRENVRLNIANRKLYSVLPCFSHQ